MITTAVILIIAVLVVSGSYLYLIGSGLRNDRSTSGIDAALITIPRGSAVPPSRFNVTQLLTGAYKYPYNFTVVIGVNNTVTWMNNDTVSHTVSSFIVPSGAQSFNSNLISPGDKFSASLTEPGIYKYTCMWHPWLAGEITVKSS
ncbi:MAG: cupredoxin domain-containing protein [Nitrososphaerales archaeon]